MHEYPTQVCETFRLCLNYLVDTCMYVSAICSALPATAAHSLRNILHTWFHAPKIANPKCIRKIMRIVIVVSKSAPTHMVARDKENFDLTRRVAGQNLLLLLRLQQQQLPSGRLVMQSTAKNTVSPPRRHSGINTHIFCNQRAYLKANKYYSGNTDMSSSTRYKILSKSVHIEGTNEFNKLVLFVLIF